MPGHIVADERKIWIATESLGQGMDILYYAILQNKFKFLKMQ